MEGQGSATIKKLQPILSTIFDISSVKPSSVAVPGGGGGGGGGGCTALSISDPVATHFVSKIKYYKFDRHTNVRYHNMH